MNPSLVLAALSSLCFGTALITGRMGLRHIDARAGAAVSIPTATVIFLFATPFALDGTGFDAGAAFLFAAVGLVVPSLGTILTFRSNEQLGPTVTGALSGTAPLFALIVAALFLGESVSTRAALAVLAIVIGIAILSLKPDERRSRPHKGSVLWALAGAMLRGIAQAVAKAGLLLWPNPFAAGLIGYTVSSATVIAVNQLRRGASAPKIGRAHV